MYNKCLSTLYRFYRQTRWTNENRRIQFLCEYVQGGFFKKIEVLVLDDFRVEFRLEFVFGLFVGFPKRTEDICVVGKDDWLPVGNALVQVSYLTRKPKCNFHLNLYSNFWWLFLSLVEELFLNPFF